MYRNISSINTWKSVWKINGVKQSFWDQKLAIETILNTFKLTFVLLDIPEHKQLLSEMSRFQLIFREPEINTLWPPTQNKLTSKMEETLYHM